VKAKEERFMEQLKHLPGLESFITRVLTGKHH